MKDKLKPMPSPPSDEAAEAFVAAVVACGAESQG